MPSEHDEGACPVCRHPVAAGAREVCPRCSTAYHRECLQYAGRCAVFGCEPGPAAPVKKPVVRRCEIPVTEQLARCMAPVSFVVFAAVVLSLLELNSAGTQRPARSLAAARTAARVAAPASAAPPPPAPPALPSPPAPARAPAASPRPAPQAPAQAIGCPDGLFLEDELPWKRELLDGIVLAGVRREHAAMTKGGARRLVAICYEGRGSRGYGLVAYLCYAAPGEGRGDCHERIVAMLAIDPVGHHAPTVAMVESTAIASAAAAPAGPAEIAAPGGDRRIQAPRRSGSPVRGGLLELGPLRPPAGDK